MCSWPARPGTCEPEESSGEGGRLKNNRWTYPDRDSVLRGCAGALFGALPLLYTMEMWWYGRTVSDGFLLLLYVPTVGVVVLCLLFGGFRLGRSGHIFMDTLITLGIGLAVSIVTLLVVGQITPGVLPLDAAARMVAIEAIPCAIGAALAVTQFRPRMPTHDVDRRIERMPPDYQKMLAQFEPNYPPAAALARQIDALDNSIEAEERRISSALRQAAGAAGALAQAAAGVGYGEGFAGNAHRFAPSGMLAAVKYLVEEMGADVNAIDYDGNTALHHAAARGDVEMILYLVSKGADPKIATVLGVTALHVAAGIGWVEGITTEWSPKATFEAVKMLIDLGLDVNAQADTGRTAMHGAAHKGRVDVIQILADHGAKLDVRDYGNTDNRGGKLAVHTWQAVDYADGLVRVGVQSAIGHPETGLLIRKLMEKEGLAIPPIGRTLDSICITDACD